MESPYELLPPDQAESLVAAEKAVPAPRARELYTHLRDAKPEAGVGPLHALLIGTLSGAELSFVKRLLGLDPTPLALDAETARTKRTTPRSKQ